MGILLAVLVGAVAPTLVGAKARRQAVIDRTEAIARMRRALDTMVVEGIKTTIPLQRQIMDDSDFIAGKLDTAFMERFLKRTAPI